MNHPKVQVHLFTMTEVLQNQLDYINKCCSFELYIVEGLGERAVRDHMIVNL